MKLLHPVGDRHQPGFSKEEKEEQEDAGAPLAGERGEEPADDIDMEAANQAPQEPANNQAKAHI